MSDIRTEAELVRLARVLGAEVEAVQLFAPAGPEVLRRLTEQISDALLAEQRGAFEQVAAIAERLPAGLVTKLAQSVLGPTLAARAAAALEPGKAAELARRLPPEFLARVATAIDPRHVADVLGQIEAETAAAVGAELEAGGELVPMGLLMAQLSPPALAAAAAALSDESVLRAGAYVEDPQRLDEVVAGYEDERLRGLADTAERVGLEPQIEDLISRLGDEQRRRAERLLARRG